jgi:metallophosphoesterase (TIGR00282 family)
VLNILFVGDIVGRPGRSAVRLRLGTLVQQYKVDLTIANAENAAGGLGLTKAVAQELLQSGIDVLTNGNHVWRHREIQEHVTTEPRILRPANYPAGAPGNSWGLYETAHKGPVGVTNLIGRTFMEPLDCPFQAADREIQALRGKTNVIVVDMHAEATSEKIALGWYLDGRVSVLVGTHTHVQTADERILPKGTAYITDVGMTGPRDSVLGVKPEPVISRFRTGMPTKFELATGPVTLNAIVASIDPETGTACSVERVMESVEAQE